MLQIPKYLLTRKQNIRIIYFISYGIVLGKIGILDHLIFYVIIKTKQSQVYFFLFNLNYIFLMSISLSN